MDPAAIRSLLFTPGDSAAKIRKAIASEADAVIIDLEDAVAPAAKDEARLTTRAALDEVERLGKPVFVRVNAAGTGLLLPDLAVIVGGRPWGIVVPKCRDQDELRRIGLFLDALETREGRDLGSTRLLAISTETAEATLAFGHARARAPRLWGTMWGAEDLSAALGAESNRDGATGEYSDPFRFARTQCLYAAAALGVMAVDAVFTDLHDLDGLEREGRAALRDGFVAKAAIHPAQAATINRVFTPSPDCIAWARQVVDLLATAGVARLDGRMIDRAHLQVARRILDRARILGAAG